MDKHCFRSSELEFITGANCMIGKEGFIELGLEDLKEQIGWRWIENKNEEA